MTQSVGSRPLDDSQVAEYAREGFVIARGFFTPEEIDLLRQGGSGA